VNELLANSILRKNIVFTLLLLVLIASLFPYAVIEKSLEISFPTLKTMLLIAIQLLSVAVLITCYVKISSKTLKLFWLYMALAVTCALVGNSLPPATNLVSQQLTQDFTALFVYFFILLAVETNPHLSDSPLNKFTLGRVPALFFTVICFSYFILLPAEFAEQAYLNLQPSFLFHILLNSIILVRLIVCLINSDNYFWQKTFALLSLAVGLLLINNILVFESIYNNEKIIDSYFTQILTLAPYNLLIFAANTSLLQTKKIPTSGKVSDINLYILLLSLLLIGLHLCGRENQLFYITQSSLQAVLVFLWVVMAFALIIINFIKVNNKNKQLKTILNKQQHKQRQIYEINKQLSEELINSEDKAIVNASNNAILTVTIAGEILSANPSAVKMFQTLEQEFIGVNVSRLFSSQDEMHYFFDFSSNVYLLQRKELGISVEANSLRFDGSEFPSQVELQWAERESQPLIVITFINLTERKLAEKQTLALKDQFIANISHEFRTPLTIINGIIDRYLSKTSNDEEQKNLTTAKRNGLRLVRMVEQLLELSRLRDNPRLSLSCFRLENLMSMPIDSFSRLAKERQLNFTSQISTDLWLECDAQAFENIIFNLLSNAIKYTPAGGSIKVHAYSEQETIILDVIDSGIGISQNSQAAIFERFQRADDPLNQTIFGVGIGLSLVNELVKAHGWRINLNSEKGQGSKFSLSIPLAEPTPNEKIVPISLSESEVSYLLSEQANVIAKVKTDAQQVVLVIEDNVDMQGHIKQVIEQQHHCLLAGSGEDGLTLAQEYLPDLIVCDLMLTGIDGFEVLQHIKDDDMTAHIPVILLTARSDLESRLQGLNLNADEYLSKPFNQDELLSRIQSLLENRKKLQQSYLKKFSHQQKSTRFENSQQKLNELTEDKEPQLSLDDKFLSKLEMLIAEKYTEAELDIIVLAKELAMSERQLQRKIKMLLGTTPNNFIKIFRLQKAQELLKSGAQIGRIALDVGFSSQTYFGRCFKEQFNCTPKQYQQQLKQDKQSD